MMTRREQSGLRCFSSALCIDGSFVIFRSASVQIQDLWPNPEEICGKEGQAAALRDAIAKSRPSLRKVVEIYELQECSMHETSKILGSSVAAAKARLFHARTALRRNKTLVLTRGG
jgi:DNA-directed RNA polymerase specialized sigma24 family protein